MKPKQVHNSSSRTEPRNQTTNQLDPDLAPMSLMCASSFMAHICTIQRQFKYDQLIKLFRQVQILTKFLKCAQKDSVGKKMHETTLKVSLYLLPDIEEKSSFLRYNKKSRK
ncbi:hypothetical protein ACOSP7_018623 [Xanthoceras sorbifolium]